jgi:hypothetical protein
MSLLKQLCKKIDSDFDLKMGISEFYDGKIIKNGGPDSDSMQIGVKALSVEEGKKICVQFKKIEGDLLQFTDFFDSILTHPAIKAVLAN